MQNTWSGQLDARSYLWRPWFGTWDLGATATHVLTEAETDSEVTVVSGDGQLRLFPRSRIPFMAFANVQDTRVELDADTIGTPDTRITRFGLMQQYKTRSGASDFAINYERNIFDQLDGDLEDQTNDIAKLRAKRKGEDHRVSVDFNLLNSDRLEDDELSWDSIARHGYEPNDQLSLDSSVRVGQAHATDTSRTTNSHWTPRSASVRPTAASPRAEAVRPRPALRLTASECGGTQRGPCS
ncbi:MAG: hypothetical protein JRG94_26490 [Deltaproteobacteria bacterium]|nr:hypothetical protein [Deltaproteobacteria bacterium]